jgi:hypothetical protein
LRSSLAVVHPGPSRLAVLVTATCLAACSAGRPPAAPAAPCPAAPSTPAATPTAVSPAALEGAWVVDLRGAPGDEPYTQPFVVEAVDETARSLRGSFYNSEISWSRFNTAWGKLVITFITSDGQGEYVHTATLEGDTLVGSSTAQHRNLLVPWTATRAP